MEESIVIQLYQFIGNYTAYRHLYGHLIIPLVRACSDFNFRLSDCEELVARPENN